ncbi:MAG: ABC-ATPase domain-containing protein [Deltaproteobacteria bacterium]|nr:ABC-ATPase domain-containing protein [Deltaproteobacteria bacterium]
MPDQQALQSLLRRIDDRPYPAYRDLTGTWSLGSRTLILDHVQGDPYASPSRVRLRVATDVPARILAHTDAREAAEDGLLRRFGAALWSGQVGSGRSGELRIYRPGPEVVERSALRLLPDGTAEVRFTVGLPAQGRRVLGRQAYELLTRHLDAPCGALRWDEGLEAHVRSVQVQRALRRQLSERGLVAFVADGSVLPRASGVDAAPLPNAIPWTSPPSLRVTLQSPAGEVSGTGFPEGVTLIAGGGFHGKSTLLQALQRGHLDHIPGDGRELVVSLPSGVKIRAEDGRRVEAVDISPFLRDLPGGTGTAPFSTEDASGSTSQAAALVEAAASGARLIFLDEDTSATNLLVRDERMRALIPAESEPITPLVERIQQVHRTWGTSSVLVVGGVGDFLAVADTVLVMEGWRAREATAEAHAIAPTPPPSPGPLPQVRARIPLPRDAGPMKVRARDDRAIRYGEEDISLLAVEQVLDATHASTIGEAIRFLYQELVDGERDMTALLRALDAILDDEGVEALSSRGYPTGDLIRPRRHEVAAALSRLRTLTVRR